MDTLAHIPVTALGMLVAAACVLAGGPVFARGLRALRLRRLLDGLHEGPLDADSSGCVLVRGRVALDSPLFAPISGRACAGFELAVCGERGSVGGVVRELRAFRLVAGDTSARVSPERACWNAAVTGERTLLPGEELSTRLGELLGRSAEVRWLRDRRATLRVVERALESGAIASVLGVVHRVPVAVATETMELAATGTDGRAFSAHTQTLSHTPSAMEMHIDADEPLERLLVSAESPRLSALRPTAWHAALALLGPVLTLGGLLYLARGAGALIVGRL
jgi:hypothetical protein